MDQIKNNRPSRREFLELGIAGALGLSLAKFLRVKPATELLVYVGTYTTGKSEGIYLYRLNLTSGELKHVGTTRQVVNPSFLTLTTDLRYLYAVNEVDEFGGKRSGAVSAFAINQQTGELRLLNQQASLGASPCYVAVDARGKFVLVANYTGGNVSVFPVQSDGSLGAATDMKQDLGSSINRDRQEGPHAHCIVLSRSNRFAYSCDLGTDKIMIFRFDNRSGKLQPASQPWVQAKPGAGPRHLAFHPGGKYVFVINELDSTITPFARDEANGSLTALQTVTTLPGDFSGSNTGADIHVSPDGRFVYCSNRGHNSIAAFAIDSRSGGLTVVGHEPTRGQTPRNFAVDPTGAFLLAANQNSDSIVVFRRDQVTGRLTATGQVVEVPAPVCLKFAKVIG
ncbi:MAG TPA: lactonase family protein [Pyrinomonadaceae bacterium]|nr:lactonase family protein [Pyrinomonadaceae bacterium]